MTRTTGCLLGIAVAVLVLGIGGTAYAFHSGGVAECTGCHSMHDPLSSTALLLGTDASSTCLNCHQHAGDTGPSSYHISTAPADMPAGTAPLQRTPGGDFGWLKKTYTFTVRGNTITEDGSTHGHNIVASDYTYLVDPSNGTSPGGAFPSADLACNSCHDQHGQWRRLNSGVISKTGGPIKASGSYTSASNEPDPVNAVGVYRLLRGATDPIGFPGVPAAKVPSSYNRTEATSQTRAAYGLATTSGHTSWGLWCATCHADMHSSNAYVHPVDQSLSGGTAANYNSYVKSGDMTGGSATSFTSLVPFIENNGTYAGANSLASHARNDDTYLNGPSGSADRVSCLSCHRAHASGWEYGLRWNIEGEFMVYNGLYPGTDNGAPPQFARGRTAAETQAAYYDRPVTVFASYQRVLCNKCHAKD